MLKFLLLTLFLSSVCVTVWAEELTPQLDPRLEIYMDAFPVLWERRNELTFVGAETAHNTYFEEHLYDLLSHPIVQLVDKTTEVDTLLAVYEVINQTNRFGYANDYPYLDLNDWNKRIVERWLAYNPVNLSTISEFSFEPYTVTVERHHFTSTDKPDILLRVDRGDYMNFWLAVPNGTSYELRYVPVGHYARNYSWSMTEGAYPYVKIRDVNNDGLMELIVERCLVFPGTMHFGCRESYLVYGWLNEEWQKFIDLNSLSSPWQPSDTYRLWEFENLDEDPALELVQDYAAWDNYDCLKRRVQVFDWTGEVYTQISDETTFEETMNCAIRFGQAAMFEQDYAAAAEHYALAVARFQAGEIVQKYREVEYLNHPEQYAAYAQERLFIAYMMAGQTDNALALLDSLRELEPLENTIAERILAIPADQLTAETVCQTVYEHLENNFKEYNQVYRNLIFISHLEDDIHLVRTRLGGTTAATAGCDWPSLQQPTTPTAIPTATSEVIPTPRATASPSEAFLDDLSGLFRQMRNSLGDKDPEAIITAADVVLSGASEYLSPESDHALLARLYRAAALELLGRDEEARAEYTIIYETAPDSIWGGIADIHLSVP